ncbi:hypothetical protein ACUOA8_17890, partial [Escherichia sp. SS-MK2]
EHKTFDNMILTGIDYEYKTESALQFTPALDSISPRNANGVSVIMPESISLLFLILTLSDTSLPSCTGYDVTSAERETLVAGTASKVIAL